MSEAFGGAAGPSAPSSYALGRWAAVRTITGTLPTLQTAACWVAVTDSGRYAYAANTGSNTITGYAISPSGALTRLSADGVTATTGRTATDVALSRASRYLYSRGAADGSLTAFRVGFDGGLTSVGVTRSLGGRLVAGRRRGAPASDDDAGAARDRATSAASATAPAPQVTSRGQDGLEGSHHWRYRSGAAAHTSAAGTAVVTEARGMSAVRSTRYQG